MLVLDGSQGEGGGQILRSALALSLCTGVPFRIDHIRAGRPRPGLMRQHLTAVLAAAQVGAAEVSGASIGSQSLTFRPTAIKTGDYCFSVGTAGSATLVLQTILPALLTAHEPSRVVVEGGTHNPASPPFDFLARCYLPLVAHMGPRCQPVLERPGFYPAGGGRLHVDIAPAPLKPMMLMTRGAPQSCTAKVMLANLPRSIGEREVHQLQSRLGWESSAFTIEHRNDSPGPGNVVLIEVRSENVTEVFTAFGDKGVRAEAVANAAADGAMAYLAADVPVGVHLADQLILLLALAGGGAFRTLEPSRHTKTQGTVIERFLGQRVKIAEEDTGTWRIAISEGR